MSLRVSDQRTFSPLTQYRDPLSLLPRPAETAQAARTVSAGADSFVDGDARLKSEIQSQFKDQFGSLAADEQGFHELMQKVFGEGYDQALAEQYRQKALDGNFDWLPPIQFVDRGTLQGGNGAYAAAEGVVYIASDLKNNPSLAAQTYVEEAAAHLDAQVNHGVDAAGDEGELFRRILSGEKLSATQVAEIKAEDDHGVITVNGKQVQVEFWNPFKAIKKAVKAVGNAIGDAAKAVGNAVGKAAKAVGNVVGKAAKAVGNAVGKAAEGVGKGLLSVGQGVLGGLRTFGEGIGEGVGGFFKNIVKGKVGEAFKSLARGADKAFLQAPTRVFNGVLNGVEDVVMGATHLLGPLGGPARAIVSRGLDIGRSVVTGVWDATTGAIRNVAEGAGTFVGGLGKIFTGDFSGGFKDMGMGLVKTFVQTPADAILLLGGRAVSAVQTAIGLEPPGRRLRDDEIKVLQSIYGDTIDYSAVRIKEGSSGLFSTNDRPFTHGNTIYMKDDTSIETLVHEMAHIWQGQNGGTDYMSEALWAQNFGDGYEFTKGLDAGKPWQDLNPEQQAEFIQQAFADGYFADPPDPARRFVYNGVDYTDQLRDALRQIRNGEGAP